jgi:hypothetical protein
VISWSSTAFRDTLDLVSDMRPTSSRGYRVSWADDQPHSSDKLRVLFAQNSTGIFGCEWPTILWPLIPEFWTIPLSDVYNGQCPWHILSRGLKILFVIYLSPRWCGYSLRTGVVRGHRHHMHVPTYRIVHSSFTSRNGHAY